MSLAEEKLECRMTRQDSKDCSLHGAHRPARRWAIGLEVACCRSNSEAKLGKLLIAEKRTGWARERDTSTKSSNKATPTYLPTS